MSPVLNELAGNGRGQQILAVAVVVFLSSGFSTGISWWWTAAADQKLGQIETEARQARRDLLEDVRREAKASQDHMIYRLQTIETKLAALEAKDQALQDVLGQELRAVRDEIGRRVTFESANDLTRRRDAQMTDIVGRLRELERAIYSGRGTPGR